MGARKTIAAICAVAVVLLSAGTVLHWSQGSPPRTSPAALLELLERTDRVQKAALIEHLPEPPQIVVLGGSRALRFDPAYIRSRTGLRAFNAAVTGGRPEDAWALVNLLHSRFPRARFRFLWVVHADEFDARPLDPALVMDPVLSRYFPPVTLAAQRLYDRRAPMKPDALQSSRVFSADGMVLHDRFDSLYPRPCDDRRAVEDNILQELSVYRVTPAGLSVRSVQYFVATLALMRRLGGATPVIVAAPVDARICRATIGRGWGIRHRLVLALLARLEERYAFDFADLSRAASCGCTACDFYDGIHLRVSGARKVVDLVLRRFPAALESRTSGGGGNGPR